MPPRIHQIDRARPVGGRAFEDAAAALARGALVAFPTETVYGVGASTASPGGLDRLRALKQRPADSSSKPFGLTVPDARAAELYAPRPGRMARRLMRKAWPGPLTLVLEVADPSDTPAARRFGLPAVAVLFNSDGTIGLRCPDDPIARELLARADGPVVSTSANEAGKPPALSADDVVAALGDSVEVILDGGPAQYGVASTVVRISADGGDYRILREGLLDKRTIDRLAGETWLFVCTGNTCRSPMAEALARVKLTRLLGCEPEELKRFGLRVRSAGVFTAGGAPAAPAAVAAVEALGGSLKGHRSRRLTVDAINHADRIFVMTESHRDAVVALAPSAFGKVRLLVPDRPVEDPVGAGEAVYRQVAQQIDQALDRIIEDYRDEDLSGK
ncbi:MAG: Threonylcarbamoyl-AMP synthase [Phycisphaerae bacterium]|nr:Threonylcarbamoyl-AMP synthase [Phycisphaerae bacterium]